MNQLRHLPLLLCLTGCAECAPGRVADGAARLTVVSAAAVVRAIEADDRCGFAGDTASVEVVGEAGADGEVHWRVERCALHFDEPSISESCNGVTTEVTGSVEVTATKIVRGLLTGDPDRPVLPADPEAPTFVVERAVFDRFRVIKESAPGDLELISGELSFTAKPRLAADTDGVCSVATPNVAFEQLIYAGAFGRITTSDRSFDVELPRSHLDAVVGELGDGRANRISGAIQVWDHTEAIDAEELDEDYDRTGWIDSYACGEELAQPLSFECAPPRAKIAEGAARLTIRLMGALTSLINDDARCGFESGPAQEIEGQAGRGGGESRAEVEGCVLDLSQPTVVGTDCFGISTMAQGRATLRAVRTVRGWVTGSASDPIIPESIGAVTIELEADLEAFAVWKDGSDKRIDVVHGRIEGTAAPRLAIDRDSGACSISTPNVVFSGVRWSNAEVALGSGDVSIQLPISASNLNAENGGTNHIEGAITAFEEKFDVDAVLDAELDPVRFEASFASCNPALAIAKGDEDCDVGATLALGAARIMVITTGAALSAVNANQTCGFSSPDLEPDVVGRALGRGSLTLVTADCEVAPVEDVDCSGASTELAGSVMIDARRTVEGVRIGIPVILPLDLVVPTDPDAVVVELDRIALEGASLDSPKVVASFASGEISARVHPILAEDDGLIGTYQIPTPVAWFERISARDVPLTIVRSGREIAVALESAELEAFNGSFDGRSNALSGEVVIGGRTYPIGPTALDPNFDQAAFDASYACTEELGQPVPPR